MILKSSGTSLDVSHSFKGPTQAHVHDLPSNFLF